MSHLITQHEIDSQLQTLPHWEVKDGWLRRAFTTPGWGHSLMLVNQIAYIADAAWHHPDLEIGYAQVVVKLQTHKVRGLTAMDFELARRIEELATWQPGELSALEGFPKKWVH